MGEVESDESLLGLEALKQEAENAGIQGGRGDRRYAEEIVQTDDYLYLHYTQEVTEERRQFIEGEDEDDVAVDYDDTFVARSMRFLLRDDNYYAFQSTQGVYGEDAIKYILHDQEIIGLDCSRIETFPEDWMHSFYDRTHNIRKVKLDDIAKKDGDKLDDDLEEYVSGAGEPTERVVLSTAGQDNNLRTSDLVNGFVEMSDLNYVGGKDAEGQLTKLNQSGRLTFSYPANLDHEGQAERIYQATERILGNVE
jgi:hypothetical protein